MYSLAVSKLHRSLAYTFSQKPLPIGASLEVRRTTFFEIFALYRSLERFIADLEKAVSELNSLASGGAVVRTVLHNKLNRAKQSARDLGSKIRNYLSNTKGLFDVNTSEITETTLNNIGLFRYSVSSPVEEISMIAGTGHFFSELCPYVATQNREVSYEIVYMPTDPILSYDNLYENIDYHAVPVKQLPEHIERCISVNIENQLVTQKVDIRDAVHLAQLVQGNRNNLVIMNQNKKEFASYISKSFTIERLL